MYILPEDRERAPKGKSLKSKDYLYIGGSSHTADELQIAAKQTLLHYIHGLVHLV